jgi:hypothetical protein
MSEPLQSIEAVEQYLRGLLFAVEAEQEQYYNGSPAVSPNDVTSIFAVLPQEIRCFMLFRDPLDSGSPQEIDAVIAQLDSQLQSNYEAQTIETVGNQVKDLIDAYGVTIAELETYLNSLP